MRNQCCSAAKSTTNSAQEWATRPLGKAATEHCKERIAGHGQHQPVGLSMTSRDVIWLVIFAGTSIYFIDVIHISYTYHTHIIHISYTYHTHIIHISYTYHTHIIHISYTYHTHIIHIQDILIFLCGMPFIHEIPKKKCWSPVRWRQRNSPWRLARRCCARRHRRSAEAGVAARGQPRQLPWDSKHLGYLKDLNPNKDSEDSSWVCEPWSCSCTLLIWVHNNPQLWLPPSHVMIFYPQVAFKWLQ